MTRLKLYCKILCKYLALLYAGGSAYLTVEVFYRGYTHWSMFFVGAAAFIFVGGINRWLPWDLYFPLQMLIGAGVITAIEFISGCFINLLWGWNVWDYSGEPFNVLGQICLLYFGYWCILAAVCILLDDYIRYYCFKEEKPRYKICKGVVIGG